MAEQKDQDNAAMDIEKDNETSPQDDNNDNGDDDDGEATSTGKKKIVGSSGNLDINNVIIHPLVLLSVADHYHRVARGTRKRVVGVLLGQVHNKGGVVDATNSFAVPFEEDSRNPAVFYLDHNYLENMLGMFRKINAKEGVVGFYSSGPQIRPNDLRIHDIVQRFCNKNRRNKPVFCIIDIRPDRPDLPVTSYKVTEEQKYSDATKSTVLTRTFAHVSSEMGAMEAEEVGVEHLLRDIHDPTVSTVASRIQAKLAGLETLQEKLVECKDYLEQCANGTMLPNPDIVANLQTILSLLPNLNNEQLVRSMMIKTNDMHMAIYLSSLIRTVIALHNLVQNKIRFGPDGMRDQEEEEEQASKAEEEKKEETESKSNKETSKKDSSSDGASKKQESKK